MLGRVDVPDFLDADAVVLGVCFGVQVVTLDQLLANVATAALSEQGVLGAQLHTRGINAFLGVAFTVNAQVASKNAADDTFFVDQCFLSSKARIHLNAQCFGLFGQPAAQVAQRDDVVAMVVHGLGHEEVRQLGGFFCAGEHIDVIALDLGVQRGAQLFPVREEFVQGTRLEYRTGENVGADFGAFFYDTDADFLFGFSGLLFDLACSCQARGAGTYDDNVKLHEFAFHNLSPNSRPVTCNWIL